MAVLKNKSINTDNMSNYVSLLVKAVKDIASDENSVDIVLVKPVLALCSEENEKNS